MPALLRLGEGGGVSLDDSKMIVQYVNKKRGGAADNGPPPAQEALAPMQHIRKHTGPSGA